MTRTFIQTNEFSKNWDSLGFDDEDLRLLELSILEDPEKYPIMKGTGGLRKARISLDRKGKSGGARVCFVDFNRIQALYYQRVSTFKRRRNKSVKIRMELTTNLI